jgi:hypothetical protein
MEALEHCGLSRRGKKTSVIPVALYKYQQGKKYQCGQSLKYFCVAVETFSSLTYFFLIF